MPPLPTPGDYTLLSIAEKLENISLGSPWPGDAQPLAIALGIEKLNTTGLVAPEGFTLLHDAFAKRAIDGLRERYHVEPSLTRMTIRPRVGEPLGTIVGFHGAFGKGATFAALFFEVLQLRNVRIVCPNALTGNNWTEQDRASAALIVEQEAAGGKRVWITGFSAGGHFALQLRDEVKPFIRGAAAMSCSPWKNPGVGKSVPTFYFHGSADPLFRMGDVERYLGDGNEPDAELKRWWDKGHALPYRAFAREIWPWMAAIR